MFEDLFNMNSQYMSDFSNNVSDQFGQSIISDVFEPIMQEIIGLQKMGELFQSRIAEIDQLTRDLQLIGSMGYE